MKKLVKTFSLLALCLGGASQANAAVLSNIGGEVERIIVDDPADRWSRGTMVVSGRNIIIPRNMVIDLPANRQTLQELFANAPSACVDGPDAGTEPDETGLAKGDACNGSGTGAAVTILGNKTDAGDLIAGEVFLEKATEAVAGHISYINYDEGYFRVNGNLNDPTTGAMVRINDPEGRFTHQVGAGCAGSGPNCSADVRYGVDPDNYTTTASTGYPMCIPSTVARNFAFDLDNSGDTSNPDPNIDETNLTAQANPDGTGDLLCPETNRPAPNPVTLEVVAADSRRFAPFKLGDHVVAEGNFENIGGTVFLSAHTVGASVGMVTLALPTQPDYMIFDEVGWDVPGFQNQRVRDLLIGFTTLQNPGVDIFGLYYDPANNAVNELVFATTVGCDLATGGPTCTAAGLAGTGGGIFKIVHDVDFGVGTRDRGSPCAHLQAAYPAGGLGGTGIPQADGSIDLVDPKGRCPTPFARPGTLAEEFEVLSPPTRDLIGRSRHKHTLLSHVVTVDFHGVESQNGEYLNPVGLGHPEFVEINLNALNTAYIFAGIPWNMDRRLGPGGGCDGEPECDTTTPIGDPSMQLDPFPFSNLDPGTQNNGTPAPTPVVSRLGHTLQRGRPMSYWPLLGQEMVWDPTQLNPPSQVITPTDHVTNLQCTAP
jgi:hypothetical protein